MKIVSLCNPGDAQVGALSQRCIDAGIDHVELTVVGLVRGSYSLHNGAGGAQLVVEDTSGRSVLVGASDRFFYRKPNVRVLDRPEYEHWQRRYVEEELRSFLHGISSAFDDALWVNSVSSSVLAGDRVKQLTVAERLELRVPKWSVTNDLSLSGLREPLVVKRLSTRSLQLPEKLRIYTSDFTPGIDDDVDFHEGVTLLQQRVAVASEIRIIVASEVHAFELPRNSSAADYRSAESDAAWRQIELEDGLATACRALISDLGLNFGAIDFVRDDSGLTWFLEVNPNGEYAWLDALCGGEVSDSVFQLLTGAP